MPTPAQDIAAFAAGLTLDAVPADVRTTAGEHALDTIGCGLAAWHLGAAPAVVDAAGEDGVAGRADAPGAPDGLPAPDAALVLGTLCHALDYDDTHPHSVVHVSTVVVPAALAVARERRATGVDALCAIVAGSEASSRIGMAAGGRFHARGFHPTGVCGVFGAAVAASRARGLDAARTTHAIAIAGSLAGGLLEFLADGSQTKPLHAGWAAHAGVHAARLAAHGATGPATVLDGRRGFYATYLHGADADVDLAAQTADLGERWETRELALKPYPACHYVHAPVDALAGLIAEHGFGPDDVAGIVALSDATGIGLVLDPLVDKLAPRTPYDAKFSLPFCLAHRLVHGRLDLGSFAACAIADPAVLAVAARVTYEHRAYAPAPDAFPGGVRVTLRDGRVLEAQLRHQRGGARVPLERDDLLVKWEDCAAGALPDRTDRDPLRDLLLDLAGAPSLDALGALARARLGPPAAPATLDA